MVRDLYDPSQISNEMFHLTDEVTLGDQLQFISDDIERIASHPISLGDATWKDLQQVPTLTDPDIYHILKNRNDGSPLASDILSSERIFVERTGAASHQHVSLRSRVVLDPDALQESVYQSGAYHGSPVKTVSRILIKNDDILLSFVEAKRSGRADVFRSSDGAALRWFIRFR